MVFNGKETHPMANNPPKTRNSFLKNKWLWIISAVVVLAVGTKVLMAAFFPDKPPEPPLQTATVKRGEIEKTVSATGSVTPNFEVDIKAKASGIITKLPYDISDYVHKGALLVQLDPIDEVHDVAQAQATLTSMDRKTVQDKINLDVADRTLQTDLAKGQADLKTAQANYNNAHSQADRLATLVKQRFISQEEYETGMTTQAQMASALSDAQTHLNELQTEKVNLQSHAEDVKIAAATADAQRVSLAEQQQLLSETKIYAPIDGVVVARTGQLGLLIASGISNVGGGTAIMTLADLSRIFVDAAVDESDIGDVRLNQPVTITADAFPGHTFTGHVTQIGSQGTVDSNVVTFDVKIEVDSVNKNLLKPQMTANVEIQTAKNDNALVVPADAVITTHRGHTIVEIVDADGKTTHPQRVGVGINNGTDVEITSGLTEGQVVVAGRNQEKSRWRKDPNNPNGQNGNGSGNNQRAQMMMMRSFHH